MNFAYRNSLSRNLTAHKSGKLSGALPITFVLSVFLSSCVAIEPSGLGVTQNVQAPVPTPSLAILGTNQQTNPSDPTTIQTPTDIQSPTAVLSNAPQPSPLKPRIALQQDTNTSAGTQLAITQNNTITDPAVAQVNNLAAGQNQVTEVPTQNQPTNLASAATPQSLPVEASANVLPNSNADIEAANTINSNTTPAVVAAAPVPVTEDKKPSLFERIFGINSSKKANEPAGINERIAPNTRTVTRTASLNDDDTLNSRFSSTRPAPRPKQSITINTVTPESNLESRLQDTGGGSSQLPGVKSNNEIFGITEDPQVTQNKQETQLASLGNLGRLSPNGLRLQHDKVQVACLKPGVLKLINTIERHYGKKPIITSGYRSPKRNRRAGGARNSQHVFCKAVDIQVEGISKWQLAKYVRSIPGRGGVGTYCRTRSVHIDIGKKRDWHHKCRRAARKKRKKA